MAQLLAAGFADDDLYRYMLRDTEKKGEAMEKYFEAYLLFFGEAGTMVAIDDSLRCGGVVFYPAEKRNALAQIKDMLIGSLDMLTIVRIVGWRTFCRVIATSLSMTSGWIKEVVHTPYIHIDMLATDKESRGKGLATALINQIFAQADAAKLPVTLETQNRSNLSLYAKLGFETVKETTYRGLTEYCMVRKPAAERQ